MQDSWNIEPSKKLEKQIRYLPNSIRPIVFALLTDLENDGPYQPNWPNYAPLKKRGKLIPTDAHHCHLKKGNPTYVACW